jgi:hypothetical protein
MGCTEVSATWCPVCGDCVCPVIPGSGGEIDRNSEDCPLHAPWSAHGEIEEARTVWGPVEIGELLRG